MKDILKQNKDLELTYTYHILLKGTATSFHQKNGKKFFFVIAIYQA